MLTDLYLSGFLLDNDAKPHRSDAASPGDSVLRAALERVSAADWADVIDDDPRDAIRTVRDQLETTGWLQVRRPAILGVIPARLAVFDVRRAIDCRSADPRPLAVGMLGVLGQMPTVLSFEECSRYRQELREMTLAAIEPILGLQQAVVTFLLARRRTPVYI